MILFFLISIVFADNVYDIDKSITNVKEFDKIIEFSLKNKQIDTISGSFDKFKNLQVISLSGNNLSSFVFNVSSLDSLVEIDLSKNNLTFHLLLFHTRL